MPYFYYVVRDRKGKKICGKEFAESSFELADKLQGQDFWVVKLKAIDREKNSFMDFFKKTVKQALKKKVTLNELAIFCRQWSTLSKAGIPIVKALEIASEQSERIAMKEILGAVTNKLQSGYSLSKSFSEHSDIFGRLFISMLEVGEVGGRIDVVLEKLADHFENEFILKEKIKSAMLYPLMVFALSLVVIFFLLIFILPKITIMLQNMDVSLPLPTKIVIFTSGLLINHGLEIGILVLAIVSILIYIHRCSSLKKYFDKIAFRTPVYGSLLQKRNTALFCTNLSILFAAGVPMMQCLEVAKRSCNNKIFYHAVEQAQESVKQGKNLSETLAESGIFPAMMVKMLSVGEETGVLEDLMQKMANYYDREVNLFLKKLTNLMEPILILFLGGLVGLIVLAVFLPLIKSISQVLST